MNLQSMSTRRPIDSLAWRAGVHTVYNESFASLRPWQAYPCLSISNEKRPLGSPTHAGRLTTNTLTSTHHRHPSSPIVSPLVRSPSPQGG